MSLTQQPPLPFEFFPDVALFELSSRDFIDGGSLSMSQVADSMGYHGANMSPQLSWRGFPAATLSFAITVHDPDAPTGSGFWHWVVTDLAHDVTEVASGAGASDGAQLPKGSHQFRNDTNSSGYVGCAPPTGDAPHRYVHTVHALDVESLKLEPWTTPAVVGFHLRFHAIGRAQIVGTFGSPTA